MPAFGRSLLAEFPLDPSITYLNHGTVGVTPRRVLAAQQAIRDEIERQPSRFLLRELTAPATSVGLPRAGKPRLREAADAVAAFLGARRRGSRVRRQRHHRRQRRAAIVPVRSPATRSSSPISATAA